MDKRPFGVNLKRTGADPVRNTGFTSSSAHPSRKIASIHTPLKPANVQDLKAMFDDKKGGSGTGTTSSSGTSSPQSGAMSPRSGTTSPRSGSSSPGHTGLAAKKSDSHALTTTKNMSLLSTSVSAESSVTDNKVPLKVSSGVQRSKLGASVSKSVTTISSSSVSSLSSSRDNIFPSRINIDDILGPSATSKTVQRPSVRSWSPKSLDSKISSQGLKKCEVKTAEKKIESRVEIPVQHIITKKPLQSDNNNKSELFSKSLSLPSQAAANRLSTKETTKKSRLVSSSSSRPEGKSDLLSSRLSSKKSSRDKNHSDNSESREIPVQRISSSNKTENVGLKSTSSISSDAASKPFTRGSDSRSSGDKKLDSIVKPQISVDKKSDPPNRPQSPHLLESHAIKDRKLSNERFERLKFDFERGVPTESQDRRASETADHITLQIKARDLHKAKGEEELEENVLKREESIFSKGMKVSDFVKHINTVHPPANQAENPVKKFKAGGPKLQQTSDPDPGRENEYTEMPEEPLDNGIYEFVGDGTGEEEKETNAGLRTPGRRYGVYRKEKSRQTSLVKKLSSSSAVPETENTTNGGNQSKAVDIELCSGEDWSSDSSGTDYEPVEGDNFYEDPEALDTVDGRKLKEDKDVSTSLGNKLKKNVDKATNYLNKFKFSKKKPSKEGSTVIVSGTGTDSEGDVLEDEDGASDCSPLSRTSSERSSGRLTRIKDKELTVEIPKMQSGDEEEHGVATPPPPLPPRASKVLKEITAENSPPLPPRNPSANLTVSLDVVIPVTPPANRRSTADLKRQSDRFSFGRDSYLGSQEMLSGSHSDSANKPDSESSKPESYLDCDPASPKLSEKTEIKDKTTASQSSRSSNSSYLYPDNICDWPQLQGDSEDDDLYIELADEQIYGCQDRIYKTTFESEPLYQWYAKDKLIRGGRQLSTSDVSGSGDDTESSTDDSVAGDQIYEDVERLLQRASTRRGRPETFERNAPARRSVIMDVFGRSGSLHRALWCEMPEVKNSGILATMDPQEKKVQESMFEIMTSEASYLRSLNVLINVFLKSPEFGSDMSDRCVITKRERQFLFSNIGCIRDISAKFLADLEARWQESCIMNDISDIVAKHAKTNFEPYIRYCSNQAFQERTLESLQKKADFCEAVRRLEQNSDCQFLPMSSFLLLPMQRITRLPLLVDAVRHRVDRGTERHKSASRALDNLNHVVKQCNDGAKKMLQTEQMCLLAANIEFTKVKEFPLVSSSRYLVKQGGLNKIVTEGTSRIPFGRKSKEQIFLFLFSDILLITKKRGNTYQVRDYCQRNALHTELVDSAEKTKFLPQGAVGLKNLFLIALLSNHEGKQVELVLSAKSESERTRWLDAILPHQGDPEYERIYEDWGKFIDKVKDMIGMDNTTEEAVAIVDCPQVQCVEKYIATEPDELTLEESDVVNVFKKMADGWFEGERIRDGERGWFPADHTEEINNSHVRARNLRLRYRLMLASQEYTSMRPGY